MGVFVAEFPAIPLWTDAYLGDTTHFSTIEHGAFLLLLFTAWRTSTCDLPDDDVLLAKYCRMTQAQWQRVKPTIMAKWRLSEGRWSNGRLLDERDAVRRRIGQRSDAGKASALKRQHREATSVQRAGNETATTTATPIPTVSSLRSDTSSPPKPSQSEALEVAAAMQAYNSAAQRVGWSVATKLTQPRITAIRARLKDSGGLAAWQAAMTRAAASDFLTGRASRGNGHEGWAPDLDWFLKPKNLTKLMEGSYDNRKSAKPASAHDKFFAAGESLIREILGEAGDGDDSPPTDAAGYQLLPP